MNEKTIVATSNQQTENAGLIIIGSGLAGYMLAKEWRKLDAVTPLTIITADDGAFYSKPLLSTALTQQKTPEQLVITSANIMAQELNAEIMCYSVVENIDISQNLLTLHNQPSLRFHSLVLACGAQVIRPLLSGDAVSAVQSVNNLTDYRQFREFLSNKQHIAILGAGLVGCEFANDLVNAGYHVSVIAPDAYPFAAVFPPAVGKLLQAKLSERGVNWYLNQFPQAVKTQNQQYVVALADNQEILVDGVFSAVGLRPNIDLARRAGLRVNRGVVVNRRLQTSCPSIFALGDCAEVDGQVQLYVAPLLQSARALAKILAGGLEPVDYPVMPIVVKTPVLPLVYFPAPAGVLGDWHIEGEDHHLRALFYDQAGQLRGFVLVGDKIRDKMPLAKQLPLVF